MVALLFVGWLVIAAFTAIVARSKGRNGFGWFCLAFLISPIALIAIVGMPSLKSQIVTLAVSDKPVEPGDATQKTCPDCAERVNIAAKICRFCRHAFDSDEEKVTIDRASAGNMISVGDEVRHKDFGDEVGMLLEVQPDGIVKVRFPWGVEVVLLSSLSKKA